MGLEFDLERKISEGWSLGADDGAGREGRECRGLLEVLPLMWGCVGFLGRLEVSRKEVRGRCWAAPLMRVCVGFFS